MELEIRTGTEADVAGVLALWRAAEALPTVTDGKAGLQALLAHDPEALLVAARDGELVGSLIAAWDGWRGSFYRLAVHPASRRRGVGTTLIRAGERRLVGLGARRLTAIVAEDERHAAGLWEAVGYERQADRARFVRNL